MKKLCPIVIVLLGIFLLGFEFEQDLPGIRNGGQSIGGLVENYPLNTSGTYTEPATPTFEMDFSQAAPGNGNTVTPNIGPVMTQNGTGVTRILDGTWPAGISGTEGYEYKFASSYLLVTNAGGGSAYNPSGDFSVWVVFRPSVTFTGSILFEKGYWAVQTTIAWFIGIWYNTIITEISSDGTENTGKSTRNQTTGITPANLYIVLMTYHYTTNGNSILTTYLNKMAPVVSSVAVGPVFTSTGPFYIGGDPNNTLTGNVLDARYYTRVITSDEYTAMYNQWMQNYSNKSNYLSTVNAAPPSIIRAPAASGTQPFLFTPPLNTAPIGSFATGQGGIYVPGAKTNLIAGRTSFETWSAGSPVGWTSSLGTGSTLTQDTINMAHGASSAKLTQAGDTAVLYGPCSITNIGGSAAFYGQCYAKKISGTASCKLMIQEYSDDACATFTADEDLTSPADVSTSWSSIGHSFSSNATIGSWQFIIACFGDTAITDWDACELYAGSLPTDDVCVNDADTTASCNASVVSGTYQLSTKRWHIGFTASVPDTWTQTSSVFYFLRFPGTSGNNNRISIYTSAGTLLFSVFTSTGDPIIASVACTAAAHADVNVTAYHAANGVIKVCCNGVCGAPVTGATITTPSSTYYLGGNGTVGSDVWIRNLKFYNK